MATHTTQETAQETANRIKEATSQVSRQVGSQIDKALHATATSLEQTSGRIGQMAQQIRHKNSQSLWQDLSQGMRHRPVATLVGGAVIGWMLGRALR
jgi:hypothetical protein